MQNQTKYYILNTIYLFVIAAFNVFAQEGKNIAIDASIGARGIFQINKVYFSDLDITKFSDFPTQYSLQVISTENKILFEKYLQKDFISDQPRDEKIIIPIFYTGSSINFFYNKQKLASVDLTANFCKSSDKICYKYCALKAIDSDCFYCGNGVCETSESKTKCPQDCSGLKIKSSGNLTLPEDIYIESDESFVFQNLGQDFQKQNPGIVFYISFATGILAIYFLFRKKR